MQTVVQEESLPLVQIFQELQEIPLHQYHPKEKEKQITVVEWHMILFFRKC